MRLLSGLILFLFLGIPQVQAEEMMSLYRGVRSTAMGGVYTAMGDDEQTLWLQPAGLAHIENRGVHLIPIMNDLSLDTYTVYTQNASSLTNLTPATLNVLMGKNVYGRGQVAPTFYGPNFGIGVIADLQGAFYSKNQALPQMNIGYMTTWGVQASFAYAFSKERPRKGDVRVSVGASAKVLFRRGGYNDVPLITLLGQTNLPAFLESEAGRYGFGFGMDVGALASIPLSKTFKFNVGSAWLDIANTSFSGANVRADPIQNNLSVGVALKYDNRSFVVNLSYDYRNILQNVDWVLKHHLGLEFGWPMFRLAGGVSQNYLTAGISLDIWIAKLWLVTYAVELGTSPGQDENRRYIMGFDAKF